jgi:hypothetical protein
MDTVALPAGLIALALGGVLWSLRCLADHLLASALIYAATGAGLAAVAAKLTLDRF